jgi:hypothetical protein
MPRRRSKGAKGEKARKERPLGHLERRLAVVAIYVGCRYMKELLSSGSSILMKIF